MANEKTIARIRVERRAEGAAPGSGQPISVNEFEGPGTFLIGRLPDRDLVLDDASIGRAHAEIKIAANVVTLVDGGSRNGTRLAGQRINGSSPWTAGQIAQIGPFSLTLESVQTRAGQGETIVQPRANGRAPDAPADRVRALVTPPSPVRGEQAPPPVQRDADATRDGFPGRLFADTTVSFKRISDSGHLAGETTYLAIGGGLGSFVWVDHLRVFGVAANDIRVLGLAAERQPYAKYARLCRNSQIPDHERLRSNSISAPDNVWGFPGYASRETFNDLKRGKIGGFKHVLQVFGEPAIAESYTPRTRDLFSSLDRESKRIGWDGMWVAARVLAIRKTDDGRYAVAYRTPNPTGGVGINQQRDRVFVARYLHLATGYPAHNYLRDLQIFRQENPGTTNVVNAYEEHDAVYHTLEKNGGTALVRGRGIVASRILQRLHEGRAKNANIRILHQMRTPTREGHTYDLATRPVVNDTEQQPFNWPKAAWGGSLRKRLEAATPDERPQLLAAWGGTTTAARTDWDQLVEDGKREGWYKVFFGDVKSMKLVAGRVVTQLAARDEHKENITLEADYVIDCTGVTAKLDEAPLFVDLFKTYELPRNKVSGTGPEQRLSGLAVTNSFEIASLRNGQGRVYGSGVVVANGPYAALDSFLGLQYAALRSVDHLYSVRAPGVSRFGVFRSLRQWFKWCRGAPP